MASYRVAGLNNYYPFTFKLLHNLHVGKSKSVKKCTITYPPLCRLKIGRA